MTGINYLYIKIEDEEIAVSEKVWSKFMLSNIKSFPALNVDGKLYRLKTLCTPSPNDEGGVTCHGEAIEVDE